MFGLGKTSSVDSILVNWPNGKAEIFPKTGSDQSLSLSQGQGKTFSLAATLELEEVEALPIHWTHADPLIFHYMGEKLIPFATRDDLARQVPGINRKHASYGE